MRPRSAAAALGASLLARSSCSWVFPSDLEDGDYTVKLPVPGSGPGQAAAITKRTPPDMADFFDPDPPPPPARTEEWRDQVPLPVSRCLCRYDAWPFPPRLYRDARRSFEAYCAAYLVPSNTIHVSVARNGTVGVFVCNLSQNLQPCSMIEYKWAEDNYLDPHCQSLVSGQVEIEKWLKWYGRAYPGDLLCGPQMPPVKTFEIPRPFPKKQIIKGMPKFLKPTVEKPLFDEPIFDIPAVDDPESESGSDSGPESDLKSEFDEFDPEPKWEARRRRRGLSL